MMKRPIHAATFVDNHDMGGQHDRERQADGLLVHPGAEGYPCIFWYDYYNNGLARPGTPNGIDALIEAHHKLCRRRLVDTACGPGPVHHAARGMEGRTTDQPGLIYVLNNLGDKWAGTSVKTKWQNQKFVAGGLGWA